MSEQTALSHQMAALPDMLVGPLLRRVTPSRWVMWRRGR